MWWSWSYFRTIWWENLPHGMFDWTTNCRSYRSDESEQLSPSQVFLHSSTRPFVQSTDCSRSDDFSFKLENPIIETKSEPNQSSADLTESETPSIEAFHTNLVHGILKDLKLLVFIDTMTSFLSDGQLERLSVRLELVAYPNFLVLNEPISGLDSSSSIMVIDLLKTLAKSSPKMAILLTIHQPSYKFLSWQTNNFIKSEWKLDLWRTSEQNVGDLWIFWSSCSNAW